MVFEKLNRNEDIICRPIHKTKLIFLFHTDHCMVDFVKPSLLGTEREFNNRFVAPITNGQYEDSTPYDVKLMKKRAHVLHEMLAGCVQVRDFDLHLMVWEL